MAKVPSSVAVSVDKVKHSDKSVAGRAKRNSPSAVTVKADKKRTRMLSVRVPAKLLESLDEVIDEGAQFTGRPDFVVASLRFANAWFEDEIIRNAIAVEKDPSLRDIVKNGRSEVELRGQIQSAQRNSITEIVGSAWAYYNGYAGDSQLITVSYPCSLAGCWEGINRVTNSIRNFQEYARIAIILYLRYLKFSAGVRQHSETWLAEVMDGVSPKERTKLTDVSESELSFFSRFYLHE